MSESIVAKFTCQSVTTFSGAERVELTAAHGPGNESWSKATPGALLQITISNPEARGRFEPGKNYMLTIATSAAPSAPLADKEIALMRRLVAELKFKADRGEALMLVESAYVDHVGRLLLELPTGRGDFDAFLRQHDFEYIPADTFANTPSRIAPILTKRGPAITTTGNHG